MQNLCVNPLVDDRPACAPLALSARRVGITTAVVIAADALAMLFAWSVSFIATGTTESGLRSLAVVLITICVLAFAGLYPGLGMDVLEETKRLATRISLVQVGIVSGLWVSHAVHAQVQSVVFWGLSIGSVLLMRSLMRAIFSRRDWWGEPILLVGSGGPLAEVFGLLARHPRLGLYATGILSESGGVPACASALPALHDMESAIEFARQKGIRTAVVSLGMPGCSSSFDATARYGAHFSKLIIVPPISSRFHLCARAGTVGSYLTNEASQRLSLPLSRILKRCMDLVIATSAAVVMLPLFILIAVSIKLTSPGPIFFGHRRIGKDDVSFKAWKFRTMVSDADTLLAERLAANPALRLEWERDRKLRRDPRLTPIGGFLRKFSLDELPQLWNVFRAEMSIVGPRPICEAEIPKYADHFDEYIRVLPGLTGLWQVSGRNETTYQERVQLDSYYVNNWTPWLDLFIMARTFKAVFSARGAY